MRVKAAEPHPAPAPCRSGVPGTTRPIRGALPQSHGAVGAHSNTESGPRMQNCAERVRPVRMRAKAAEPHPAPAREEKCRQAAMTARRHRFSSLHSHKSFPQLISGIFEPFHASRSAFANHAKHPGHRFYGNLFRCRRTSTCRLRD